MMGNKTNIETTCKPMLLSDLIRSVEFRTHAKSHASTGQNLESLEQDAISEDEGGALTLEDINGWQKMACDRCMIIWAEPPCPVKFLMTCPKCGDIISRKGEF